MRISMVSANAGPLDVSDCDDIRGQNIHLAELSAALTRAGHDVTVYTRKDSENAPQRVTAPGGYTVVHVPAGPPRPMSEEESLPLMGEFGGFLKSEWEAERPDIVHAHYWMSGIATQLAARTLGIPVIQTFHALGVVEQRFGDTEFSAAKNRIRLEQLIARGSTRVVATCTDEVLELSHLGLPRSRTSVVPSGVDVSAFTPEGRTDEKGKRHRLVMAGRLAPSKGFDTAIEALAHFPDTELVIAGGPAADDVADNSEATRLLKVARNAKVRNRVRIIGRVPREDMPSLLRSADAVVCTPWYEPFGMVPLEAMACGTPVVASAVGGMRDTVVDGITGRLISPRNPMRLAEALRQIFDDDALRTGYGMAGCDRARARYSWDRVATDTLRAYGRCVSAPPRTNRPGAH
ncbi:glycosyltransferase [Rhodococcus marinonascens]|uniref:glycosyltransferase n=1 Tax=Rhodococcus marinonascens TaxID=38311 RepID=UPI0009322D14